MSRRFVGCAALSESSAEQRFAKAGTTRGWILLEQPGPWARSPFASGGVGAQLSERAREWPVKVLAIRRHGRSAPAESAAFFCASDTPTPWIERVPFDALRDLDPALVLKDSPPGVGVPHSSPLYLVCTHGSKDACCAVRGRPLAAAMSVLRPEETWECSHVGGDRFAPNVVCLPHGLFYGHVAPGEASEVVESYERGELDLRHLRGRSGRAREAQAADFLLRQRFGRHRIDEVAIVGSTEVEEDVFDVDLVLGTDPMRVRVRCRDDGNEPRAFTCSATERHDSRSWEILSA